MSKIDTISDELAVVSVRELLQEVGEILEREDGRNWLPGIRAALAALTPEPGSPSWTPGTGLAEAASIYRAMTRGPGSFGDFYIQRPTYTEQSEINHRYGVLVDELWRRLGDVR